MEQDCSNILEKKEELLKLVEAFDYNLYDLEKNKKGLSRDLVRRKLELWSGQDDDYAGKAMFAFEKSKANHTFSSQELRTLIGLVAEHGKEQSRLIAQLMHRPHSSISSKITQLSNTPEMIEAMLQAEERKAQDQQAAQDARIQQEMANQRNAFSALTDKLLLFQEKRDDKARAAREKRAETLAEVHNQNLLAESEDGHRSSALVNNITSQLGSITDMIPALGSPKRLSSPMSSPHVKRPRLMPHLHPASPLHSPRKLEYPSSPTTTSFHDLNNEGEHSEDEQTSSQDAPNEPATESKQVASPLPQQSVAQNREHELLQQIEKMKHDIELKQQQQQTELEKVHHELQQAKNEAKATSQHCHDQLFNQQQQYLQEQHENHLKQQQQKEYMTQLQLQLQQLGGGRHPEGSQPGVPQCGIQYGLQQPQLATQTPLTQPQPQPQPQPQIPQPQHPPNIFGSHSQQQTAPFFQQPHGGTFYNAAHATTLEHNILERTRQQQLQAKEDFERQTLEQHRQELRRQQELHRNQAAQQQRQEEDAQKELKRQQQMAEQQKLLREEEAAQKAQAEKNAGFLASLPSPNSSQPAASIHVQQFMALSNADMKREESVKKAKEDDQKQQASAVPPARRYVTTKKKKVAAAEEADMDTN